MPSFQTVGSTGRFKCNLRCDLLDAAFSAVLHLVTLSANSMKFIVDADSPQIFGVLYIQTVDVVQNLEIDL